MLRHDVAHDFSHPETPQPAASHTWKLPGPVLTNPDSQNKLELRYPIAFGKVFGKVYVVQPDLFVNVTRGVKEAEEKKLAFYHDCPDTHELVAFAVGYQIELGDGARSFVHELATELAYTIGRLRRTDRRRHQACNAVHHAAHRMLHHAQQRCDHRDGPEQGGRSPGPHSG